MYKALNLLQNRGIINNMYPRTGVFDYHFLLMVFLVITLIGSFGLHSLQIPHAHSHQATPHTENHKHTGEESSSLSEYMHASDRKLYVLALAVVLFSVGFLTFFFNTWRTFLSHTEVHYQTQRKRRNSIAHTISVYLEVSFSNGILHSKAY